MSVWFNVRPLKILAKRVLLDANKVVAANANFVYSTNAVAGTRMQFSLGSSSIAEFRVEGNGGGANPFDLDLVVDGVFQGTGQTIVAGVVTPTAPASGQPAHALRSVALDANFTQGFNITWLMDNLSNVQSPQYPGPGAPVVYGTGSPGPGQSIHTFELYAKGTGGAAQINAASTTNPLVIWIIEHADAYPPAPTGP